MFDAAPTGSITFTLPYPFVTQGAQPMHVYDGVTFTTVNGQTCLVPGPAIANSGTQVTLASYSPSNPNYQDGGPAGVGFGDTVSVTISYSAGLNLPQYANIHVDYGLKGTAGYAKGGIVRAGCNTSANDAVQASAPANILIKDCQSYTFSESDGTTDSQTASSRNVFKKDPGIAGLVRDNAVDPVAGVKVVITGAGKTVTVYTDIDGWYIWQFKYTGQGDHVHRHSARLRAVEVRDDQIERLRVGELLGLRGVLTKEVGPAGAGPTSFGGRLEDQPAALKPVVARDTVPPCAPLPFHSPFPRAFRM